MRRTTQRRGRQFPPQVSKEELLERTRQTLTDKGVDYVSQAKYVVNIASEVVGFDEPIFASLQPEIKLRTTPAWQNAYSLLINYLQENRMEQTLDVIDIELQGQRLPQGQIDDETDVYLNNLMKISKQLKRKTFSSRVAEFTGKYKSRKTISQTKKASPSRTSPTQNFRNSSTTSNTTTTGQKRTSLTQNMSTSQQNTAPKTYTRPPAKQPTKESSPQQQEPKQRTSLLSSLPKQQQQQPQQQTNTNTSNNTRLLNRSSAPAQQQQQPVQQRQTLQQTTQQPQQQRRSPWDPVPMAESTKPPQNSAESIDFSIDEEEEEEDAAEFVAPTKNPLRPPLSTAPKPNNAPQALQDDDFDYSDADLDLPSANNSRTAPVQQQQKAPQAASKTAPTGWDAQPMDDSPFEDDDIDVLDDGGKGGNNQPDVDIEGSASFDIDDDLSLGDD